MNSFYKKKESEKEKRNENKKKKKKQIKEQKQFQHQQKTLKKMKRTRDVLGVVAMVGSQLFMSIMTNVNIGFILPECN